MSLTELDQKLYRRAGLTDAEAVRWAAAGIGPYQAHEYLRAGLSLDEAVAWFEAGLGGGTTRASRESGLGLDEAREWLQAGLGAAEIRAAAVSGHGLEGATQVAAAARQLAQERREAEAALQAAPEVEAPEDADVWTAVGSDGHAFISYVREDSDRVDQLERRLRAAGIPVWRDTAEIWPGEDWRLRIREAITQNSLVFIACFSDNSVARHSSTQNEELVLAVDELRRRRPDQPWLIPVRFDDVSIPHFDLGGGRTLNSLQRVDWFGPQQSTGFKSLMSGVVRILENTGANVQLRDGMRLLINRYEIDARTVDLGSMISQDYADHGLAVVPIYPNSSIFAGDLLRQIRIDDVSVDPIELQSIGHMLRMNRDQSLDVSQYHILVVATRLTDSEYSYLSRHIAVQSPRSLEFCILVLNDPSRIEARYVGFRVSPRSHLVGYGLDFEGRFSNLPFLALHDQSGA